MFEVASLAKEREKGRVECQADQIMDICCVVFWHSGYIIIHRRYVRDLCWMPGQSFL